MKTITIITRAHRADVLKTTWELVRKAGLSFAKALKQAWAAVKLKLSLALTDEKGQWVEFRKVNGERRNILATRNLNIIPVEQHPKTGGTKPGSLLTVSFYDLFEGTWKSCRADLLIIA